MESLRELYKRSLLFFLIYQGPKRIAENVLESIPMLCFHVDLHGSLAWKQEKGHLTDYIIEKLLNYFCETLHFKSKELPRHPKWNDCSCL